jgi:hypothetical protein
VKSETPEYKAVDSDINYAKNKVFADRVYCIVTDLATHFITSSVLTNTLRAEVVTLNAQRNWSLIVSEGNGVVIHCSRGCTLTREDR